MRILFIALVLVLPFSANTQEQPNELKQIEAEIEKLKEETLRQKIILRQLEEAVLFGKITSTTTLITFKNLAEGYFAFLEGEFYLDDKLVYKLTKDTVDAQKNPLFVILDGEIPPGSHLLRAKLLYRVKKKGPFTYVEDYKFDIESKKEFHIEQGKSRAIEVVVSDRGAFKAELKERIAVTYNFATGS